MTARPERGGVWWADLPGIGRKLTVVVSTQRLNVALSEVVVARITSLERERSLPTAIALQAGEVDQLTSPGWILAHSLHTIPRSSLRDFAGEVRADRMAEVEAALAWTFDLDSEVKLGG